MHTVLEVSLLETFKTSSAQFYTENQKEKKKKEEKWKRLTWFRESWHRMWRHAGSILAASLFPTLIISSCSAACSSSWYIAFSVRCFFLTPTSLLTYSCSPHWPLPHSDTLLPYNTAQGSPATEKKDKSSFPTNSHWHLFSPVLSVSELDWIAKAFMIIGLKKKDEHKQPARI